MIFILSYVITLVLRLPHVNTDILLTLNTPIELLSDSSTRHDDCEKIMLECFNSLEVRDWGLFSS